MTDVPLILASSSVVRARMLRDAGLTFDIVPSAVDEDLIKQQQDKSGVSVEDTAMTLALAKAQSASTTISKSHPGALIIGADQMLECNGALYDKPKDRGGALAHLHGLRGQTHRLITACVVVRAGAVLWQHLEKPRLTMRDFSDAFAEAYLDQTGDAVLTSVGAYQLEGRGAQLFDSVEGDFFSILGLPLLPLLGFLRAQSLIEA